MSYIDIYIPSELTYDADIHPSFIRGTTIPEYLPSEVTYDVSITSPMISGTTFSTRFESTNFRLTSSGILNRSPFPFGGVPQVTFFGRTVHEERLVLTTVNLYNESHLSPLAEQRGKVTGTVTIDDVTPVVRDLRLYHRDTGILIDKTTSDADGNYQFSASLSMTTPYYTICLNENNVDYNTLIHDWVEPDAV